MLRKTLYPKVENKINQLAEFVQKKGVTPNQLTLAGCVVNFLAGWIYASGNIFLGGVLVIVASFGDLLDGAVARLSGKVTKFGAFLDSTIDRYSDFFIFGGLALHYAYIGESRLFVLVMGVLLGAYVTSYTKARAENLIEKCDVGIFERAERIIALILGSLIPPFMPLAIWVLFFGTQITAIQRILYTQKMLAQSAR